MSERDGRVPTVAVWGRPNLLLTAVVKGLCARGHPAVLLTPAAAADLRPQPPGVLVVDVGEPCAVRVVSRAAGCGWTVITLGSAEQHDRLAAAVVAGAHGVVSTDAVLADLVAAVAAGREGTLRMCEVDRAHWCQVHAAALAARHDRAERLAQLSPREREVLRLRAEGRRAAEIATALYLALPTIRTHIRSILTKLDVDSQECAVALYLAEIRGDGPDHET